MNRESNRKERDLRECIFCRFLKVFFLLVKLRLWTKVVSPKQTAVCRAGVEDVPGMGMSDSRAQHWL